MGLAYQSTKAIYYQLNIRFYDYSFITQLIFLLFTLKLEICVPFTDFTSLLAFATPSSRHPLVSFGDPSPTWSQDAGFVFAAEFSPRK